MGGGDAGGAFYVSGVRLRLGDANRSWCVLQPETLETLKCCCRALHSEFMPAATAWLQRN